MTTTDSPKRSIPAHFIGWVAVVAATVGLLMVASFDTGGVETDGERIQRLSESFACPQCRGESVSESNAAVAATIREFIADEVAAGATDEEIRNDLLQGYGTEVLLTPPADGFATLVWVLPVVALVGGAVAVATVFARREAGADKATAADRALVEAAIGARRAHAEPAGPGPDAELGDAELSDAELSDAELRDSELRDSEDTDPDEGAPAEGAS